MCTYSRVSKTPSPGVGPMTGISPPARHTESNSEVRSPPFRTELIWKAHVENKCKIFAWILVQDKILTAHNLQKRGWPHQHQCVMCNGPLETSLHLCLCCPFAKAVWGQILSWENFTQLQQHLQVHPTHIKSWWEDAAAKVPRSERRRLNGVVIYIFWNIWKERNRRIFDNLIETVPQG